MRSSSLAVVALFLLLSSWDMVVMAEEKLISFSKPQTLPASSTADAEVCCDPDVTRALTAKDLATIVDVGGLVVSPNKSLAAVQTRQASLSSGDFRLDWYILSLDEGSPPLPIGDGGAPILAKEPRGMPSGSFAEPVARWAPDSGSIAVLRQADDSVQVWQFTVSGDHREQVTSADHDVIDFWWSVDGAEIFYEVDLETAAREKANNLEGERGYLYDDRFYPFESKEPQILSWIFPPEEGEKKPASYRVKNLETGTDRPATEKEQAVYANASQSGMPLMTPDEGQVHIDEASRTRVWLERAGAELDPLAAQMLRFAKSSGNETITCAANECKRGIDRFWWSAKEQAVYFLRKQGINDGELAIYKWDPVSNAVSAIAVTDDLLEACDLVAESLVCFHESVTQPRQVIRYNLSEAQMNALFDPNPAFGSMEFGDISKVEWSNSYGIPAYGYLVKPPGYEEGKRYPLIITTYYARGFPRGGVGDEYPVYPFAAAGFMVLDLNQPRDRKGLADAKSLAERSRLKRENGRDRKIVQSSVDAAVDILDDAGLIDPGRVGLTGLSAGSEAVHYALHQMSNLAAAAASGPAGMHPSYYYFGGGAVKQALHLWGYGFPNFRGNSIWNALSVSANVDKVYTPMLIQAADTEFLLSLEMYETLKHNHKPIELHVFPGEYHIKWKPIHRYNIYRRNLQWFQFWLQDREVDEPVDPEQYERWRKLREQRDAAATK